MARGYFMHSGGSNSGSSDVTATADQVLDGYTAITKDSNDEPINGKMPNQSGKALTAGTVAVVSSDVAFAVSAAGYYTTSSALTKETSTFGNAGTGDVFVNKTFTSSGSGKLAAAGTMANYGSKAAAGTLGFASSNITIKPNNAGYYNTNSTLTADIADLGDAALTDVLSGSTFSSKETGALAKAGTMTNNGTSNKDGTLGTSGNYITIKPTIVGYYSTSYGLTSATSNFGNATPADVYAGKTFTSSNSDNIKATGTMAANGGASKGAKSVTFDSKNKNIVFQIGSNGYYTTKSTVSASIDTFGNAEAGDVLTKKTFTSSKTNQLALAGTMADRSGANVSGTAGFDSKNKRVTMVPSAAGYYGTSYGLTTAASNFGTASTKDVRNTKYFTSSAGIKVKGQAPEQGAKTWTPAKADTKIAAGTIVTGAQKINGAADLLASNILSGKKIFNVSGTMSGPLTIHTKDYPTVHSNADSLEFSYKSDLSSTETKSSTPYYIEAKNLGFTPRYMYAEGPKEYYQYGSGGSAYEVDLRIYQPDSQCFFTPYLYYPTTRYALIKGNCSFNSNLIRFPAEYSRSNWTVHCWGY